MENEENINKLIGSRILTFRESRKMPRIKLAKLLKVTQQQLSKYENGINRISAAKLALLSKKMNIEITYFYSDLFLDIALTEKNKDELNSLISCYLNIKGQARKFLVFQIAKELANTD